MPDWAAEGLLDDVPAEARAARVALLDRLHADGQTVGELRRAVAEDRLVLLPLDRAVGNEGRYTAAQAAARAGVDVADLLSARRALGIAVPDAGATDFGDEEIAMARHMEVLYELGVDAEACLEVLRVLGHGMAAYVEASTRLVGQALLRPGDPEDALAERWAQAAEELVPLNQAWVARVMALHLRQHLRAEVISMEERQSGRLSDTADTAIAFVDLVDFTALGEAVPAEELGSVAGELARVVAETLREPVRLVKTIGDAAMLAAPAPEPLADMVLEVVEVVDGMERLPALRGGIAFGEAVGRWGDFYGATVNRASRLCTRARPSAVLCDTAVHEALDGDFALTFAGAKKLKGFAAPVPAWRVRRAPAAGAAPREAAQS